MNKKQLQEKLTELNVAWEATDNIKVLKAKLAAVAPAIPALPEPGAAHKITGDAVSIFMNGAFVRSYSVADHGEDFGKLALQFVGKLESKHPGSVIECK